LSDLSAKERIRLYKRAIRGEGNNEEYQDYVVMKEMGWSWEDLENTPETVYQSVLRIVSLEAKEKIRNLPKN
jgi:hypothetical protein